MTEGIAIGKAEGKAEIQRQEVHKAFGHFNCIMSLSEIKDLLCNLGIPIDIDTTVLNQSTE